MAGPFNLGKNLWLRGARSNHVYYVMTRCFTPGPTAVLHERIQSGKLNQDDYQLRVVQQLQVVYDDIVSYTPKSDFAKFFFKSQTPKGLYVYGSVGGGKTMLMDLFYETCQVRRLRFGIQTGTKDLYSVFVFIFSRPNLKEELISMNSCKMFIQGFTQPKIIGKKEGDWATNQNHGIQ